MEAYINATCFWKQIDMAYRQTIFFLETNLSQISNKFGCGKNRDGLSPTNLFFRNKSFTNLKQIRTQ